jgi:four helix bundle protein
MKNFRELMVWKKAHEWVIAVYQATGKFPVDERFGLVSQLRRSASSITANIAEGCGREGDRELSRFMSIAAGSASESEYHLLLAYDLGFIDKENYEMLNRQINEIKKMLNSFIKQLKATR